LSLISPAGLDGAFRTLQRCLQALEVNGRYRATVIGEPQLGRRGLYPALSTADSGDAVRVMMNLLAYADGEADLLEIAETIAVDIMECAETADRLVRFGLLERLTGS
jgi:aminopeptidase-like protein